MLLGTAEVSVRAAEFNNVVGQVMTAADRTAKAGTPWIVAAYTKLMEIGREWVDSRDLLTRAMQADVSVDRIGLPPRLLQPSGGTAPEGLSPEDRS
jgi:hypothetical protein